MFSVEKKIEKAFVYVVQKAINHLLLGGKRISCLRLLGCLRNSAGEYISRVCSNLNGSEGQSRGEYLNKNQKTKKSSPKTKESSNKCLQSSDIYKLWNHNEIWVSGFRTRCAVVNYCELRTFGRYSSISRTKHMLIYPANCGGAIYGSQCCFLSLFLPHKNTYHTCIVTDLYRILHGSCDFLWFLSWILSSFGTY